jgi:predicted deacetylase
MWVEIPVKKVSKPRPEPRPRSPSPPRHFNFWSPEFALDRFNMTCSSKLLSRTLLKRCSLRKCRWNGCDAELASEWHLERHFESIHLPRAKLAKRHRDEVDAWACVWRDCICNST